MKLDFGDYVVATILLGVLTIFPADQLKSIVGVANAIQAVPEKADKLFHIDLTKGLQVGEEVAGYPVTSGFDPTRVHPVTGEVRPHLAVDIGTPSGVPIMAPFDLTIRDASNDACGIGLIASSPATPGFEFGMCHLSKKVVSHGKVGKGQVFALTGATGAGTGSHLHLTVRKKQPNGTWENVHPSRGIAYAFLAGYAEK